jgi:hypothetical protein
MQFNFLGLGLTSVVLLAFLVFILSFIIQAIFLGIGLGFVNGENRNLSSTFVTSLLMALVIWIPCLGCFIAWYFIKSRHNVGWGGALIAWLLGAIIQFLVMLAIIFLFFGALLAAIFAGLVPFMP